MRGEEGKGGIDRKHKYHDDYAKDNIERFHYCIELLFD